jgi:hypothetical protein
MSDAALLETLLKTERKGYGNQPDLSLVVSIQQYDSSRYVQLEILADGQPHKARRVTVRQKELSAVIAALQLAQDRICAGQDSFTESLSNEAYAASPGCLIP